VRILYVENHDRFAETVTEQFLGGHEVVRCATIVDALTRLASETFDAALVDHDLDDGAGTIVVRALRRRAFGGPIVAVSAEDDRNEALVAAGATAVCRKADFHAIASRLVPTPAP
jgi:CheY-like chemotaxis protein